MKNRTGTILYIGKAKNLRQRVRQYFAKGGDGREILPYLVPKIEEIETVIVRSEKEALLLENNLIKQHRPKYNALLKDDKSYIALKVAQHQWPRVDIVRYRGKPKADGLYFGPYTNASAARKTLDLLHKIFPMRQCSDQEFARRTRPCILYDIKRCVAPCVGKCTQDEYDGLVKRTVRFLRGQDKEIVRDLYVEMDHYAKEFEFEKAGAVLRTIRQIEKTIETQHVDKPLGIDADVIGIYREGKDSVLVLMFFRGGRLTGTRHHHFEAIAQDDEELLQTFLLQYYEKMEELPREVLLPIEVKECGVIGELLSETRPRKVWIHAPERGNKKAMVDIARLNAVATYKKEKDIHAILERTLLEMQERFHLSRYPRRIECFDISTISGAEPVAAMVTFTDGEKDSRRYRKYKMRTVETSDDYGAMYEVLLRRFKRAEEEEDLPDLLLVDGGKGHLNVALKVLKELNIISVDAIALAKERGRHDKGITQEQVFLPNVKDPILLKKHSPILFLLQRIRDEAHRTALAFHRKRRGKSLFAGVLDTLPGIGPIKKKRLLRHFGSVKNILAASKENLQQVPGLSKKNIETIISASAEKAAEV